MVRAFSAFCRDGTVPRLSILAPGADRPHNAPAERVCSEAIADLVREVLREVVDEGTGRPARSQRYTLFAKSGTAQLPKPGGGGYYEDRYVSSFIAGAPFDDPAIIVLVVIDDPDRKLGHWGGSIAGPPVREILEETLAYLGVPPDVLPEAAPLASVE
jgi:stage V sporulation protein D (sporulation-specific penicillin-binding protein)